MKRFWNRITNIGIDETVEPSEIRYVVFINTLFLAMFWGGGGPFTIPDIIGVCDRINRIIPDRTEMEAAINSLLALGLINQRGDEFVISAARYREFKDFLKKKRKNKFDTVGMYFKQLPNVPKIPRTVSLTEEEYGIHVKEYRRAFASAMRSLKKKK